MNDIMQLKDLKEAFASMPGDEDKLCCLIELGDMLPEMPEEKRVEENRIRGCSSQVWIAAGEKGGKLEFQMASDAKIVRGLLFVLWTLFNGKTREEIRASDAEGILAGLGLLKLLSHQRQVGLKSALERLGEF